LKNQQVDLEEPSERHGDREGLDVKHCSEEGRRFLLEQLHRLTPDHVRAIFKAAHVDQLENARTAHRLPDGVRGIDAWVAAFQDKVHQIEARRCQPTN
jgi:hypothetical protein